MLTKGCKTAIALGCIVVLAGLALMAFIGFYNRYWSDDWCYNRDFKSLGAFGALRGYVEFPGGYSSNRYSLTLFSGLLYLPGLPGTQVMTVLVILLWLGGLYWNFYNLSRISAPIPNSVIFLASSLLLYFTLYISPQRFQILYWRAGVMPYSAAIVFGLYILAIITNQALENKPSRAANILLAPLAFLAGGFSEIGCVLLFSGVLLLFLWAGWARWSKKAWAAKALPGIGIALAFLSLSMLALIISPANARVENVKIINQQPIMVPWLSIKAAGYFVINAIKTLPLPHLVLFIIVAALPAAVPASQGNRPGTKDAVAWLAGSLLATFLLLVAIHAPTIYFYSAPPDPRGQSLARFVMLAGLTLTAWLTGWLTVQKVPKTWLQIAALIVLLTGIAYTARTIPAIYAELPGYISRAEKWDARDAYIRAQQAQGIRLLEVKMIDTAAIDTRDLLRSKDSDRDGWVKSCAAEYYGLDGMRPLAP